MDVTKSEDTLTILFPSKIDYHIVSDFEKSDRFELRNTRIRFLQLDFALTEKVTLPGILYVFVFISSLLDNWKSQSKHIITLANNCSDLILNEFLNLGFIHALQVYCTLNISEDLKNHSNNKYRFWTEDIKRLDRKFNKIFWPISRIPLQSNYTENAIFFNKLFDYFRLLLDNGFLKNLSIDDYEFIQRHFLKTINETIKNVWDHSESWGAISIHSREENMTNLCIFDNGIGFINSYIKRKGEYTRTIINDIEVLRWLFQEGNTSNENGNFGHGLAIITKFIDITNGVLLIRTDRYQVVYKKANGLQITPTTYFNGSQISINF